MREIDNTKYFYTSFLFGTWLSNLHVETQQKLYVRKRRPTFGAVNLHLF